MNYILTDLQNTIEDIKADKLKISERKNIMENMQNEITELQENNSTGTKYYEVCKELLLTVIEKEMERIKRLLSYRNYYSGDGFTYEIQGEERNKLCTELDTLDGIYDIQKYSL